MRRTRSSARRRHLSLLLLVLPALALAPLAAEGGRSAQSGVASSPPADAPVPVSRAWPVMGTLLIITVWGEAADSAGLLRAVHGARDSVRLVDSLLSNYSPVSEISAVNDAAGGRAVPVSENFMAVMREAGMYWRVSHGAFDPTVAPLVHAWGFDQDSGRIPPQGELDSLRALVNFGAVQIDSARRTVRLPLAGMRLDFGGIAKGYALDLAREALHAPEITGGMIDLGGNVRVFGHPPGGERWAIGIRDPRAPRRLLGVVRIDSGAVATSGDYEHFFTSEGQRYAHLIDVRTGRPARGVAAAVAIGPCGVWSDGLSATLFLSGPERGREIADSLSGVGAVYVLDPGAEEVERRDVVLSTRAAQWVTLAPTLP